MKARKTVAPKSPTSTITTAVPSWDEIHAKFFEDCKALDEQVDWVRAITVNKRKLGVGYVQRPNPEPNADPLMLAWVEMHHTNKPFIKELTLQESVEAVRKLHSTEIMTCCDSESGDDGFDRWLGDLATEV